MNELTLIEEDADPAQLYACADVAFPRHLLVKASFEGDKVDVWLTKDQARHLASFLLDWATQR